MNKSDNPNNPASGTRPIRAALEFREEGTLWNCYLAIAGAQGKILVGSFAMGAIHKDAKTRRLFMNACKRALSVASRDLGAGPITEWTEQKPTEPKGQA